MAEKMPSQGQIGLIVELRAKPAAASGDAALDVAVYIPAPLACQHAVSEKIHEPSKRPFSAISDLLKAFQPPHCRQKKQRGSKCRFAGPQGRWRKPRRGGP
ncbi:hypothetical protein [Rhodobium gokarnense]|uniref:Primosomal protein N n=1 Tax=Rhodobium gokarnense TaxID=364296 RepID=A0ABT3H8Q8_9HYPH|nr:hypothetical protein [Rhodobium gokarnense]MCW2306780.1 primosomal protein N' [Rhodobium gokarnense]